MQSLDETVVSIIEKTRDGYKEKNVKNAWKDENLSNKQIDFLKSSWIVNMVLKSMCFNNAWKSPAIGNNKRFYQWVEDSTDRESFIFFMLWLVDLLKIRKRRDRW